MRTSDPSDIPPRKEDAECCEAKRLPDGRPVLGFCSPECIRRPDNWKRISAQRKRRARSLAEPRREETR